MTGKTWRGAESARLEWVDGVPRSLQFDDTYYTREDGLAECSAVFLKGCGLPVSWQDRTRFTILETGFGTGLNFLVTLQAWRRDARRPQQLHFVSVEGFPLDKTQLGSALQQWEELATLRTEMLGQYPPPMPGVHRLEFDGGQVTLDLVLYPLDLALPMLRQIPDLCIDAFYLDGFAPARNPGMWTEELYQTMARQGVAGSRFATFTAAGDVRRGLAAAGFSVEKRPGHGNKREMLVGELDAAALRERPATTPWHLPASLYPEAGQGQLRRSVDAPGRALVIGAGLAGASTAQALARRGWTVAVYDRDASASGASGNSQGVLYTRVSHRESALNSFSLHSFCYAARRYRQLFAEGRLLDGIDGELCGSLHLATGQDPDPGIAETLATMPGLAVHLDREAAAATSGLADCPAGLFFPDSGWLSPPAVCRAWLSGAGIELFENAGDLQLRHDGEDWTLIDAEGAVLDRGNVAVIACGHESSRIGSADWLTLRAIRGQTTQIPSRGALRELRTVICHEGYLPPAAGGEHCIGATFDLDDPEPNSRQKDHEANVVQLSQALPSLTGLPDPGTEQLEGRTGFRCASPDYLPIVGPVPDAQAFCSSYAELRRNARRVIAEPGRYLHGLYLSTGHGSRGLTSTPLTAELLAAQICGEPWPLPVDLAQAVSPARFLVRDLARGRL